MEKTQLPLTKMFRSSIPNQWWSLVGAKGGSCLMLGGWSGSIGLPQYVGLRILTGSHLRRAFDDFHHKRSNHWTNCQIIGPNGLMVAKKNNNHGWNRLSVTIHDSSPSVFLKFSHCPGHMWRCPHSTRRSRRPPSFRSIRLVFEPLFGNNNFQQFIFAAHLEKTATEKPNQFFKRQSPQQICVPPGRYHRSPRDPNNWQYSCHHVRWPPEVDVESLYPLGVSPLVDTTCCVRSKFPLAHVLYDKSYIADCING